MPTNCLSVFEHFVGLVFKRLRLKPSACAKILNAGDIPIKLCNDSEKSSIDSVKLELLSDLLHDFAPTTAELNPADIIWVAGWMTKKSDGIFHMPNGYEECSQ